SFVRTDEPVAELYREFKITPDLSIGFADGGAAHPVEAEAMHGGQAASVLMVKVRMGISPVEEEGKTRLQRESLSQYCFCHGILSCRIDGIDDGICLSDILVESHPNNPGACMGFHTCVVIVIESVPVEIRHGDVMRHKVHGSLSSLIPVINMATVVTDIESPHSCIDPVNNRLQRSRITGELFI